MKEIVKIHSKIGIASCVIGTVMFLLFLIVTIAYYFQFKQGRGANSEVLGLLQLMVEMILPVPIHVIGLILGIVSVFFPNRKKLFPILGIVLNLIFGVCSLFP